METPDVAKCAESEISPLFPWDQLDIYPKQLGSVPYSNVCVPIYQHVDNLNETIDQSRKRFFYLPIALLDYTKAVIEYSFLTSKAELRLPVLMWKNEVEEQISNYLCNLMGKPVLQNQIEIVPFDRMMLVSSNKTGNYKLSNKWRPYRMQKYFWFSLVSTSDNLFGSLMTEMHSKPRQFLNDFTLLFSTASEISLHGEKARYIELGFDTV